MTRVEVGTLPAMAVLSRSCREESAAKVALLDTAGTFSPRVEDHSSDSAFVCVIDIAGTEKLFGTAHQLGRELFKCIRAIGITASIAVSVNVHAAKLFVAGAMLEQLIVRAASRVLALASVTITLSLEGNATHVRTVRPALPTNDRQLWIKLLHLDLEAHPPSSAILALALCAEPGSTSKVQPGLFSPQLPEPSRLDVTLVRIAKIVGEENVGKAVLLDTHHEQQGFRWSGLPSRLRSRAALSRFKAVLRCESFVPLRSSE